MCYNPICLQVISHFVVLLSLYHFRNFTLAINFIWRLLMYVQYKNIIVERNAFKYENVFEAFLSVL